MAIKRLKDAAFIVAALIAFLFIADIVRGESHPLLDDGTSLDSLLKNGNKIELLPDDSIFQLKVVAQ